MLPVRRSSVLETTTNFACILLGITAYEGVCEGLEVWLRRRRGPQVAYPNEGGLNLEASLGRSQRKFSVVVPICWRIATYRSRVLRLLCDLCTSFPTHCYPSTEEIQLLGKPRDHN